MFNKAFGQMIEEVCCNHPEISIFRRKFNASIFDSDNRTVQFYFRSNKTDERVVFFTMSRDDYDKYIQKPYNLNAHSYARAFHTYHHLQDTGQLEKWRKLAREHRLLA